MYNEYVDVIREKKFLIIIGVVAVLAVLFFTVFRNNKDTRKQQIVENLATVQSAPQEKTISGNVLVSGYIQTGSTVTILARQIGDATFQEVYTAPAKATLAWTYTGAENGAPYEVKARLITPEGIYESELTTVVAPAQQEDLRILSKAAAPAPQTVKIGGTVTINGIIPQGATITLAQKNPSNNQFTNFGSNIQAKNGLAWNWNSAKVGNTYEIIAYLISGGQIIGTSNTITTSAPATDMVLTINSQNTGTQEVTTISGILDINGVVPNNSSASLGIREVGETSFDVLGSNISPLDGVGWSWNSAESGKSYEIQGYIQTGNTPIAQSEIITVTAPAKDQVITLNVDFAPEAPAANTLTVSCVAKNSKDKWQVRLTMNAHSTFKNASEYHLQFGSIQSSTEFIDSKIIPADPTSPESLTTDYILTPNTTYYAKYSYQKGEYPQFSPFSPPLKVACQ